MAGKQLNPKDLFTLLVNQLSAGAWSQLGKTSNPLTGKPEKNLEAAAVSVGNQYKCSTSQPLNNSV